MKLVLVGKTIKCELPPALRGIPDRGEIVLIVDKISYLQADNHDPPGVIVHMDNGETTRVFMPLDVLQAKIDACYMVVLEKDVDGVKVPNEPI